MFGFFSDVDSQHFASCSKRALEILTSESTVASKAGLTLLKTNFHKQKVGKKQSNGSEM